MQFNVIPRMNSNEKITDQQFLTQMDNNCKKATHFPLLSQMDNAENTPDSNSKTVSTDSDRTFSASVRLNDYTRSQ
jgi:hypothetical protein